MVMCGLLLTDEETEAQGSGLWGRARVTAPAGCSSGVALACWPGCVFIVSADLY